MCDVEMGSGNAVNVTLSADEDLLRKARDVARRQGTSLNEMFRNYLRSVTASTAASDPADELFRLIDEGGGSLHGQKWTREELYERR
jgi:hypothetical protein